MENIITLEIPWMPHMHVCIHPEIPSDGLMLNENSAASRSVFDTSNARSHGK